jgi:hypothetical protein
VESVDKGCHSDGTSNYRDHKEDIQMHLALPLLGVDNSNAISESSIYHRSRLMEKIPERCNEL